jgi:hypothetical protein
MLAGGDPPKDHTAGNHTVTDGAIGNGEVRQRPADRLPVTRGSGESIPDAIERRWMAKGVGARVEREQFDDPRKVQACLIRMKGRRRRRCRNIADFL